MKKNTRKSFMAFATIFSVFVCSFLCLNTAYASDFSLPPTIPGGYTDYLVGRENGGASPAAGWVVLFFTSSTAFKHNGSYTAIGSGNIITNDTDTRGTGGGNQAYWNNTGTSVYYPCTGFLTGCTSLGNSPGAIPITNGTSSNLDASQWVMSSRTIQDENGNILYTAGSYPATPPTGSQTAWIGSYIPANGAYSTTSPTTFSAYYYFNCNTSYGLYDSLTFQMSDLSNPSNTPIPSPQSLGICGQGLLTMQIPMQTGDSYLWRPEIYSSTGSSTPIYGNWYFFQSTSTPAIDINTAVGSTLGTSTLPSTTNLLSFLNVPVLLQTKAPFAYIFEIASGIIEGVSASNTTAIPSGSFIWHGIGGATTTFDMFSTTTISYYFSPTLIGLWRAFVLVVLTVEFGYALYSEARKKLHL